MLVLINALVAYRLTRLWVDDMLPPLPRVRDAINDWAYGRDAARLTAAIQADRRDPAWQAEADEAGKRALRGGYTASTVIGTHEQAEINRQQRNGGMPILAYLTTCYWCSGFWIALAVVLAASLIPATAWLLLAAPLALSATTGLISSTRGGK